MDINLSRRYLFGMFAMLYFVQGVIQAYQLNFFKPHMDSEGIDADRLAIVASLALLPFIIKWIYGVISDRYNLFGRGHRVPYMQIGLVSTAIAFFLAYFIDPSESFGVLAAMVLMATFFMALFDTTADALAVDVVPPTDHSRVQAFMTGGRAAGLVVVSLIFGLIADSIGYQAIFLAIAALMLIPLVMVRKVREPAQRTPAHTFDRGAFRVLLQPRYFAFALFLILAWTFFQGIDGLVTFYMSNELDSSGSTIGWYGTLKGVGMVIGAVGLSYLMTRFGRRTAALTTVILVTLGGLMFSVLESEKSIVGVAVLWGIAVGLQWTTYVTMSMGVTDTRIAGSMFAILQTMSNIGIGAGEGVATSLSDNIGFSGVFRSFALANLLVIPLILFVTNRFARMYERTETDAIVEEF
ncbi:MAG: MFS transporter [Acidimicrobiia bacterium]|nr:MFS transporter [Acidimicrobiia bacterium]